MMPFKQRILYSLIGMDVVKFDIVLFIYSKHIIYWDFILGGFVLLLDYGTVGILKIKPTV